jgi:hypothetical protein
MANWRRLSSFDDPHGVNARLLFELEVIPEKSSRGKPQRTQRTQRHGDVAHLPGISAHPPGDGLIVSLG